MRPAVLEQFELMAAVRAPLPAWQRFHDEIISELGRVEASLPGDAQTAGSELSVYAFQLRALKSAIEQKIAEAIPTI